MEEIESICIYDIRGFEMDEVFCEKIMKGKYNEKDLPYLDS